MSVNPSNPKAITASISYSNTRQGFDAPQVQQYVWNSSPGAGTWTTITGSGLPSVAVSRVVYYRGALAAATDSGVYATASPAGASTSWSKLGAGLPNVLSQDLYVTGEGLYVATYGRGVWLLPSGAPLNTAPPTITGAAASGQRLTEHHGTWSGSPTSYHYQWLRCNSQGYACLPIGGATAASYVLRSADVGHRIEVLETAGNAHGSTTGPASTATAVAQS